MASSPEDGKGPVERQAAAILIRGAPLDQVIPWLACHQPLPDLPERSGLPQSFRWIKPHPTAKRSTIVAYGEQCVAALLQRNRTEPVRAILAVHRTCAPGARHVRHCTSWDLGKRGVAMWLCRHQDHILREIQQANRLREAANVADQLALPPQRHPSTARTTSSLGNCGTPRSVNVSTEVDGQLPLLAHPIGLRLFMGPH